MNYPTYDELARAGYPPEPLWIGTHEQLQAYGAQYRAIPRTMPDDDAPPLKRNHNKPKDSAPRTFKIRYVGVTVHRNRWLAQWGPRGKLKSAVFPLTPEGERSAAMARARALGLSQPEMRPADVVCPPESPPEPRGKHAHRFGGKRIA